MDKLINAETLREQMRKYGHFDPLKPYGGLSTELIQFESILDDAAPVDAVPRSEYDRVCAELSQRTGERDRADLAARQAKDYYRRLIGYLGESRMMIAALRHSPLTKENKNA